MDSMDQKTAQALLMSNIADWFGSDENFQETPLDGLFGDSSVGKDRPLTRVGEKLFAAVRGEDLKLVKRILKDPELSVDDLNGADPLESNTPLCEAAQEGRQKMVKELLDAGADPSLSNRVRYTPLHLAALNGYADVMQNLLDHDADVNARNHMQETPLILASCYSRFEAIKVLLKYDADVSAQDWKGTKSLDRADGECQKLLKQKLAEQKIAQGAHAKRFEAAQAKKGKSLAKKAVRKECTSECAVERCEKRESLKKCAACLLVAYCSRKHQKSDWKAHKHWCRKVVAVRSELATLCDPEEKHQFRTEVVDQLKENMDLMFAVKGAELLVSAIKKETSEMLISPLAVSTLCFRNEHEIVDVLTTLKFLKAGFWSAVVDLLRPDTFDQDSAINLFRGLFQILRRKELCEWVIKNEFNSNTKLKKFCSFSILPDWKVTNICTLTVGILVTLSFYDKKFVKSGLEKRAKKSLPGPSQQLFRDMYVDRQTTLLDIPWKNRV